MPIIFVSLPLSAQRKEICPEARRTLERVGEVVWNREDRVLESPEKSELMKDADGIVTGWGDGGLSEGDIDAAPKLKIIGIIGSAVKRFSAYHALSKGITIVNTAAEIGNSVAELALAFILSQLRNLCETSEAVHNGSWSRELGSDLTGRTVGVIGAGAVGKRFIELLAPFHAKILVCDPYLPAEAAASLGCRLVLLEELLRTSDVISLHAGSTEETVKMLSAERLSLVKAGCVLVNTSRGALIDEAALADVLKQGKIKAALDVYEKEPLPAGSPLRGLPNVLLTPHIGGYTHDTYRRVGLAIARDFELFFSGKEPVNKLTKEMIDRAT